MDFLSGLLAQLDATLKCKWLREQSCSVGSSVVCSQIWLHWLSEPLNCVNSAVFCSPQPASVAALLSFTTVWVVCCIYKWKFSVWVQKPHCPLVIWSQQDLIPISLAKSSVQNIQLAASHFKPVLTSLSVVKMTSAVRCGSFQLSLININSVSNLVTEQK